MVKKSDDAVIHTNLVSNRKKHSALWESRYIYAIIAPAVIFTAVFSYVPLAGLFLAFKEFDIMKGLIGSPWVGFDHFVKIFTYPAMAKAVWNSLIYGLVLVFGCFPFAVILALLFNEIKNRHFKKVVQTISYMPYFLSWISVISMLYVFFATEGPLNQILGKIIGEGYENKNILMESKYFLPVIFFSSLWKNVGWSSVIYLAAIAGIDPTLYEAASIDGCGKLKQAWYVTLPSIMPVMVIVLVMAMGTLFKTNFEQVYGLQNVYTQQDTEVISTLVYRQGIENGEYSLATAFGFLEGLVSVILLLSANGVAKKLFHSSIW